MSELAIYVLKLKGAFHKVGYDHYPLMLSRVTEDAEKGTTADALLVLYCERMSVQTVPSRLAEKKR